MMRYLYYLMDLKSKLVNAKANSTSLRTTVPEGIVSYLDLQAGDTIYWRMIIKGNKKIVIVTN